MHKGNIYFLIVIATNEIVGVLIIPNISDITKVDSINIIIELTRFNIGLVIKQ